MGTVVLAVVLFPVWFGAILVGVTYTLAHLVFPGGGSRGPDDTLAGRIAGGAASILLEWVASIWVVLTFPYKFMRNEGVGHSLGKGQVPVAILPGHSENALTMFFLERRLARKLRVPVRAFSPKRYYGGLERIGREFKSDILQWMEQLDADLVDLVGHSQGGLLSRYLVEMGGMKKRVRSVVTIGTPHQGSALSVLLPGSNARQMRRGSFFLEKLNQASPARGVRMLGICSTHDNLVLPWHCGLSPRGDNYIMQYRGHLTLILSGEVVRLVAKELAGHHSHP